MKTALLAHITSDLSEASVEDAWIRCAKPEIYWVVVGTKNATYTRTMKFPGPRRPSITVNPDWTEEWLVGCKYLAVFNEAFSA